MTKYFINKGLATNLRKEVEAVKYTHSDGYFHFFGPGPVQVFSARAADVYTIERDAD